MKTKAQKKNFDYFESFCIDTRYACEAADAMRDVLTGFDHEHLKEYADRIHHIENEADTNKHELTKHLTHEFITPIEREDIMSLAQELDNVVDSVDDVMRHIYMFDIKNIRPDAVGFADIISRCCHTLNEVTEDFRSFRKSATINDKIIMVNTLESEGDVYHAAAVRKLFTDGSDPVEITTWIPLYEDLEACLDACEHVTDIIESVIMKNS